MKTKIVLWGENEKEEKILLGIELLESDNLIRINIIPESDATEIFYNQMMNQWREGQHVPMPDSTEVIDRPLSMTEGLLPDNIKTQRQDILARAKTEWHFVILSSKLYEAYADEINQIKERIEELSEFDSGIWEEMKTFWKKVQNQVQEKNLFREHAAELRAKTNELFDSLKSLKRAMNDEFERASKDHLDQFFEKLKDIEERIEKGLGLQPIFNELKDIQQRFRDVPFTRKHHNDVWKRLDGAFKKVKEKKFGKAPAGGNTALNRLSRRLDGLLSAIGKMEQSINRDIRDKQFQERRIGTTDGQLEMQIRQAKMAMIEERITSKQAKLDDMVKTRTDIEQKIASEKERSERIEAQRLAAIQAKEAQKAAKENIAKEIESNVEAMKASEEQLQKAAQAIKEAKKKPPAVVADESNVVEEVKVEAPSEPKEAPPSAPVADTDVVQAEESKGTEQAKEPAEKTPPPLPEATTEVEAVEEEVKVEAPSEEKEAAPPTPVADTDVVQAEESKETEQAEEPAEKTPPPLPEATTEVEAVEEEVKIEAPSKPKETPPSASVADTGTVQAEDSKGTEQAEEPADKTPPPSPIVFTEVEAIEDGESATEAVTPEEEVTEVLPVSDESSLGNEEE